MCGIYASIQEKIISVDSHHGYALSTSIGVTATEATVIAIISVVVLFSFSNSAGGWCCLKCFLSADCRGSIGETGQKADIRLYLESRVVSFA